MNRPTAARLTSTRGFCCSEYLRRSSVQGCHGENWLQQRRLSRKCSGADSHRRAEQSTTTTGKQRWQGSLVQVKVPDPPVANRGPQLQRGAQEELVDGRLHGAPLLHLLALHRVPGCVLNQPARSSSGTQSRWGEWGVLTWGMIDAQVTAFKRTTAGQVGADVANAAARTCWCARGARCA